MYYKVTFSKWFDYTTPMIEGVSIEELEDMEREPGEYLVEAKNMCLAKEYAMQFEGLETRAYQGIGKVLRISVAGPADWAKLTLLSVYKVRLSRKGAI